MEIYRTFYKFLDDPEEYSRMSQRENPYEDCTAAKQIADILGNFDLN